MNIFSSIVTAEQWSGEQRANAIKSLYENHLQSCGPPQRSFRLHIDLKRRHWVASAKTTQLRITQLWRCGFSVKNVRKNTVRTVENVTAVGAGNTSYR